MKNTLFRFRKICALFVAALALVGTATAAEAPEIKRRLNNGARLRQMHPYMQPKVGAILGDLENHGLKPLIHADVYRSAAKQAQLKGRGVSKVGYSFHMVTDRTRDGRAYPAAMAADIIDNYKGYAVPDSFWLKLASSANAHNLSTGIYWGLTPKERLRIQNLFQNRTWNEKFRRGWDPAHVQPHSNVLTLGQAKAGRRPPVPKGYERTGIELLPVNPKRVSPSGRLLEAR